MRVIINVLVLVFLLYKPSFAQMPTCPSPYVYRDGGSFIKFYDPSQPLSGTNPGTINIPTFGSGLTLMPNINGGTLSPTFYSTSGGTYWYWNGAAWVNTNHSTGNAAAVNIAGCGGSIYNLVGGTGAVYVYNGTGNGSLLTTLSGFNGGGPYDLQTDCNCNFYALNTTSPNQTLTMYNPQGQVQCTYTMTGMANTTAGGGFAIIGNKIYVKNNITNGFFIGTISGASITFTQVSGFTASPGDFASCPVCYPSTTINGISASSGMISCSMPTLNLIATTTASPVFYNWSGPGIVGPSNGSVVAVNAQGIYTCMVSAGGCPPTQASVTSVVVSNSIIVIPVITPSGNICIPANTPTQLVVASNSTNSIINWSGPGVLSGNGTATVQVNAAGSYTVAVTDLATGCTGYDVMSIAYNPTMTIALSANTICAQALNGTPASMNLTVTGAPNYSCNVFSPFFSLSTTNNTVFTGTPAAGVNNLTSVMVVASGSNAYCTHSTSAFITILPNPTITISPPTASICPYNSQQFIAFGATSYTWNGSSLNNYNSVSVTANPSQNTVYMLLGESLGCYSSLKTASLSILPLPVLSVAPLASVVCLGGTVNLVASGTATNFTWSPSNGLSVTNSASVTSSPTVTQFYTVLGALNGCTAQTTATVVIVTPPILNLSLSSNSMCAYNYNNSVNSLSLIPSGALSYSLIGGPGFGINNPTGPIMQAVANGTPQSQITLATATLIGVSGVCTASITKTFSIINNPIISLLPASATICPGKSKVFGVTGASTYSWLPNINFSILTPTSMIAYPSITSFYSVIGNQAGCNSATKNAVLLVLPVPNLSIAPSNATVCAGGSVTLTAVGDIGALYTWSPNNDLSSSFGNTVVSTPTLSQTYTAIATLNTCTNYAVATVSAIQIPVITTACSDKTVCIGGITQLYATGADSFSWEPEGSLVNPLGSTVMAVPMKNTTFTVHGFNGICTGASTLLIKTIDRPDLKLQADENQICYGRSMTLSVTGAQSYDWQPLQGVQNLGSTTLVALSPTSTTNYTITGGTHSGTVSCYSKISYVVQVSPYTMAKVSESVALCLGQKTTLKASGGDTYKWYPSIALNTTSGSGVVANPTTAIIYSVDVSWGGYCSSTSSVYVEVLPKPTLFAGRDSTYNLNEVIFINATGTGTLTWISGDGIVCKVCPTTRVNPFSSGCYIAEAINKEGCTLRDEVCIEITKDFNIYIPNTFTPNNDGVNDVFYVYGENIFNVTLEVFDRWGARVFISKDQSTGWDGTYKGTICKPGDFTYTVSYLALDGKRYERNGHVSILK